MWDHGPHASYRVLSESGLSRRDVMARVALGGAACLLGPAGLQADTASSPERIVFDIYRKDAPIGQHAVDFARDGAALNVRSNVELEVKIAFVTLYRYRQVAVDRFENLTLVESDVETDDNGKKTRLTLEAVDGRLKGRCDGQVLDLELGMFTDLCWWTPSILEKDRLLDAQTGEVTAVQMGDGVADTVLVGGRETKTTRYHMSSTRGRQGEIWYDAEGRWVKALVETRGQVLDYRLVT